MNHHRVKDAADHRGLVEGRHDDGNERQRRTARPRRRPVQPPIGGGQAQQQQIPAAEDHQEGDEDEGQYGGPWTALRDMPVKRVRDRYVVQVKREQA
jgi:hypothetical protein